MFCEQIQEALCDNLQTSIYRSGSGASPKGNLPFIDRQNIHTLETERLWRCKEGTYETVVAVASSGADSKPTVITNSQTPTTPPNYFLRNFDDDSNCRCEMI